MWSFVICNACFYKLFVSKYDYDSEFQSLVHCFVTYLGISIDFTKCYDLMILVT